MERLLLIFVLCLCASAQITVTGTGWTWTGSWSGPSSGPLLVYPAQTNTTVFNGSGNFTGAPLLGVPGSNHLPYPGPTNASAYGGGMQGSSSNNQFLYGMNQWIQDPDLNGEMTRATDWTLNAQGRGFLMGSGGSYKWWSSDDQKFFVSSTASVYSMLAFYPPYWHQSTPSPTSGPVFSTPIYGNSLIYGYPAWSASNPHVFYVFNTDKEQTLVGTAISGTCLTPGTITQTNSGGTSTANVLAANPEVPFLEIGAVSGGTPDNTHVWSQSGGCTLTPSASYAAPSTSPPYAVTLYKATLNDATYPLPSLTNIANWAVSYSMLFEYTYVSTMAGLAGTNAPYFPSGANTCLPANFNAAWQSTFQCSSDDTICGAAVSDLGQDRFWGNGYIGTVDVVAWKKGSGCRAHSTHTGQMWGDWGPSGQATSADYFYVLGTPSGNLPTTLPQVSQSGALLTQQSTGATAEFKGQGYLSSTTAPSGYSYSQILTDTNSAATLWEIGQYTGTPDNSHKWCDLVDDSACTSIYLTPSALPQAAPFYYPTVMHDGAQRDNPLYTQVTASSPDPLRVLTLIKSGTSLTVTLASGAGSQPLPASPSNANATIPIDAQWHFYNLACTTGACGASDTYLNCTDVNHCPTYTVTNSTSNLGGTTGNNWTIVLQDNSGVSNYSVTEPSASTTCYSTSFTHASPCAMMGPHGTGFSSGGFVFVNVPTIWTTSGLNIGVCLTVTCNTHQAAGQNYDFNGTYYYGHKLSNLSTPCTNLTTGVPVTGYTPCPGSDIPYVLLMGFPQDDHGSYNNHGPFDYAPMFTILSHACGQAPGNAASVSCESPFTSYWMGEILGLENSVSNNTNGICGASNGPGCHCLSGSTPVPCTYRFIRTFSSSDGWNFEGIQNPEMSVTPDGQYGATPSNFMNTLGAMNGGTTFWSSYVQSAPPCVASNTSSCTGGVAATMAYGSGSLTVSVANSFCATGNTQYLADGSATPCGTVPEYVTLSGYSQSWMNQTWQITGTTGCTASYVSTGNCTGFTAICASAFGCSTSGIPSSYGPSADSGVANPIGCLTSGITTGSNGYCPRPDVFVVKFATAH